MNVAVGISCFSNQVGEGVPQGPGLRSFSMVFIELKVLPDRTRTAFIGSYIIKHGLL
ncbi:uncharacterized protein METZ01_LOCUS351156, partial [marine metagenome]